MGAHREKGYVVVVQVRTSCSPVAATTRRRSRGWLCARRLTVDSAHNVPMDKLLLVVTALHAPRGAQHATLVRHSSVLRASPGTTYPTRSASSVQLIAMRVAMLSPTSPTA